MKGHAKTLKVEDVVERAQKVAGKIVAERFGKVDLGDIKIGWYPGHGTIGLILRRDMLEKMSPEAAFEVAETIAAEFGDIALQDSARFTFGRDFGTVGFFPLPPLELGGLR